MSRHEDPDQIALIRIAAIQPKPRRNYGTVIRLAVIILFGVGIGFVVPMLMEVLNLIGR